MYYFFPIVKSKNDDIIKIDCRALPRPNGCIITKNRSYNINMIHKFSK